MIMKIKFILLCALTFPLHGMIPSIALSAQDRTYVSRAFCAGAVWFAIASLNEYRYSCARGALHQTLVDSLMGGTFCVGAWTVGSWLYKAYKAI